MRVQFVRTGAGWAPLVAVTLLLLVGCDQQTVEDAADQATDAAQTAGEAAGEAADQVKDKLGEGFSAATESAATALEGVEGGGELLTGLKDMFASAQESLQGVTDQASAEAASAKLDDLGTEVDGLADRMGQLPDEAKSAVQKVVEQGLQQLKTLADKVLAMPGVQDAIGPKVNALIDKLSSIAQP